MFCTNCGNELESHQDVCLKCGQIKYSYNESVLIPIYFKVTAIMTGLSLILMMVVITVALAYDNWVLGWASLLIGQLSALISLLSFILTIKETKKSKSKIDLIYNQISFVFFVFNVLLLVPIFIITT